MSSIASSRCNTALVARHLRDLFTYVIAALAAPAFIALAIKLVLPRRRMLIPARAALFLIATLALGPGLVTNVILKDNWGRPRPPEVTQFNGPEQFRPWWDPRGPCERNCSFVAGEGRAASGPWRLRRSRRRIFGRLPMRPRLRSARPPGF